MLFQKRFVKKICLFSAMGIKNMFQINQSVKLYLEHQILSFKSSLYFCYFSKENKSRYVRKTRRNLSRSYPVNDLLYKMPYS